MRIEVIKRVLRYERRQFDLLLSRIAKIRADISRCDHRILTLQQNVLGVVASCERVCGNALHGRENIVEYESRVKQQIGRLELERKRLEEDIAPEEKKLIRKRVRVKSIENLLERAEAKLAQELEYRSSLELTDLVVSNCKK